MKNIATGFLALVLLLLLLGCTTKCGDPLYEIPFTSFFDGETYYTLNANEKANEFTLQQLETDELIRMEPGYIPLKIITVGKNRWLIFARGMFEEATTLWMFEKNELKRIELPAYMEAFIFRDAAFFEDRLESRAYIVLYNVVSCTNQLYRLNMQGGDVEVDEAFCNDLDFGANGIDKNVSMIITPSCETAYGNRSLLILGGEAFYRYTTWVPYTLTRYKYDEDDEVLVQVRNNGKDAESYFLTMSKNATVAKLFTCNSPWSAVDSQRFDENEAATIAEICGETVIQPVNTLEERIRLIKADLNALPCSGVGDLGSNNAEGRIPWSAVYYWNGLIDFLTPEFDNLAHSEMLMEFQGEIEKRLMLEMKVLDQLLESPHGLISNRYGKNRLDHLCELHSARVAETVMRYEHYVQNPYRLQNKQVLREGMDLEKRENSLTYLVRATKDDQNGVPAGKRYLRCTDLLVVDGVAAPYNYMTGWVSSICIEENFGEKIGKEQQEIARDFISILLSAPDFLDYDENCEWPYYFGAAYHGFAPEDQIATNISFWPGQTYTADISYRYMDSKAIISMMCQFPDLWNERVINYLSDGIKNGSLWPSVNEILVDYDRSIMEPEARTLPKYSRVRYSYFMQNAAWSFLFLSKIS